jgi:hypothetical protein
LGTPWAYKTFDGREKSLLRAATADLLPESVVQRVKSPYPSTQDARYEQVLRRRVAALLETAGPVSPLLNAEAVRERLATPVAANSGMATRVRFEQILRSTPGWVTTASPSTSECPEAVSRFSWGGRRPRWEGYELKERTRAVSRYPSTERPSKWRACRRLPTSRGSPVERAERAPAIGGTTCAAEGELPTA